MLIKIVPNDKGNPPGKLADVELHFQHADEAGQASTCGVFNHAGDGILAGLKLIGFAIWERHTGGRTVTFPARQYSINGERRSFALLRSTSDNDAQAAIRDRILQEYSAWEAEQDGAGRPAAAGDRADSSCF